MAWDRVNRPMPESVRQKIIATKTGKKRGVYNKGLDRLLEMKSNYEAKLKGIYKLLYEIGYNFDE